MTVGEDGSLSEIVVRGDDEQVERMRKELGLSEKGMVYVKGIFERQQEEEEEYIPTLGKREIFTLQHSSNVMFSTDKYEQKHS